MRNEIFRRDNNSRRKKKCNNKKICRWVSISVLVSFFMFLIFIVFKGVLGLNFHNLISHDYPFNSNRMPGIGDTRSIREDLSNEDDYIHLPHHIFSNADKEAFKQTLNTELIPENDKKCFRHLLDNHDDIHKVCTEAQEIDFGYRKNQAFKDRLKISKLVRNFIDFRLSTNPGFRLLDYDLHLKNFAEFFMQAHAPDAKYSYILIFLKYFTDQLKEIDLHDSNPRNAILKRNLYNLNVIYKYIAKLQKINNYNQNYDWIPEFLYYDDWILYNFVLNGNNTSFAMIYKHIMKILRDDDPNDFFYLLNKEFYIQKQDFKIKIFILNVFKQYNSRRISETNMKDATLRILDDYFEIIEQSANNFKGKQFDKIFKMSLIDSLFNEETCYDGYSNKRIVNMVFDTNNRKENTFNLFILGDDKF